MQRLDEEDCRSELLIPNDGFALGPVQDQDQDTRVDTVVARAWAAVLSRRSFQLNQAWDEAGGDSLGALRLWFMVEQALGPLPLEMLGPSTRPTTLIKAINARLRGRNARVQSNDGVLNRSDGCPTVFFMPPFDGDLPLLVRFRAACQHRLKFVTVHYPAWTEMLRAGAKLDLIIDAALAQVLERSEGKLCAVAGYSSGGLVAWEVGRRLLELGFNVEFVGLIDTRQADMLHPDDGLQRRSRRFLGELWPGARSSPGRAREHSPVVNTAVAISGAQGRG